METKRLRIPDIIENLKNSPSEQIALEIIANNNTPAFRLIVDYSFGDYNFRSDLLPENFSGKKVIDHMDMSLFAEARRLYLWEENSNLDDKRRRTLLADLLEGLPYDEAKLVVDIMRREVKPEGYFNEAFLTQHLKSFTLRKVINKTFNEVKLVPDKVTPFKIKKEKATAPVAQAAPQVAEEPKKVAAKKQVRKK